MLRSIFESILLVEPYKANGGKPWTRKLVLVNTIAVSAITFPTLSLQASLANVVSQKQL